MTKARAIAALLISLVCFSLAQSQTEELVKILEPVEQSQRERLAKRVNLFIKHQRARRWTELYKLIDELNRGHMSANRFARYMTEMRQVDFVPERSGADSNNGSQYRIYGCVKVQKDQKITWFQGGLVAYLQKGDWYFTPHFLRYDRTGTVMRSTHKHPVDR